MVLEKKDFIEINFTGRIKDGEVFDSTEKENLEAMHRGHSHEHVEAHPFIFCLGEGMFLKAIDDFLIGKQVDNSYEIELSPENGFGLRNPALIQKIPIKIFKEKNINPIPGVSLNFDGRVGKILSVSGGRVIVDFNHFLAGKTLSYKINVIRKIDDLNEKVNSLNEFFFRKKFDFEINGDKLIMKVESNLVKLVELFKESFKELLSLDLEIKEIKEIKETEPGKDMNKDLEKSEV